MRNTWHLFEIDCVAFFVCVNMCRRVRQCLAGQQTGRALAKASACLDACDHSDTSACKRSVTSFPYVHPCVYVYIYIYIHSCKCICYLCISFCPARCSTSAASRLVCVVGVAAILSLAQTFGRVCGCLFHFHSLAEVRVLLEWYCCTGHATHLIIRFLRLDAACISTHVHYQARVPCFFGFNLALIILFQKQS